MIPIEQFDDLFVGEPVQIEANLRALLPEAPHSIRLQILSQIALAEALQKNFDAAHRTLDEAESQLAEENHLPRTRILLERGRVFWQSGDVELARPLFDRAFALSAEHHLDEHTCNAAHLIAIIAPSPEEKIEWNERAIALAKRSEAPRARAWLGSLYNNLGAACVEAKRWEKALDAYQTTLRFREQEGHPINIRVAKWAVARALRFLGREGEALKILHPLLEEYATASDVPEPILRTARGLVYEELAEIYAAKAYSELSQDEWFQKLEPERLERLKR